MSARNRQAVHIAAVRMHGGRRQPRSRQATPRLRRRKVASASATTVATAPLAKPAPNRCNAARVRYAMAVTANTSKRAVARDVTVALTIRPRSSWHSSVTGPRCTSHTFFHALTPTGRTAPRSARLPLTRRPLPEFMFAHAPTNDSPLVAADRRLVEILMANQPDLQGTSALAVIHADTLDDRPRAGCGQPPSVTWGGLSECTIRGLGKSLWRREP